MEQDKCFLCVESASKRRTDTAHKKTGRMLSFFRFKNQASQAKGGPPPRLRYELIFQLAVVNDVGFERIEERGFVAFDFLLDAGFERIH